MSRLSDADFEHGVGELTPGASWGSLGAAVMMHNSRRIQVTTSRKVEAINLWESGRALQVALWLAMRATPDSGEYGAGGAEEVQVMRKKLDDLSHGASDYATAFRTVDGGFDIGYAFDPRSDLVSQLDVKLGEVAVASRLQRSDEAPDVVTEFQAHASPDEVVIIVNVSNLRCDAFLVLAQHVRHEFLPFVSLAEIDAWARRVREASERVMQGVSSRRELEEALQGSLDYLLKYIVEPALCGVRDQLPTRGRLHATWCVSGSLAFLPIQAATIHAGHDSYLQRFVNHRASSLGMIAYLRRTSASRPRNAQIKATSAAFGMPITPGMADLPGVHSELQHVQDILGDHVQVKKDPPLKKRAILDELELFDLLHFACHAVGNLQHPHRGALLLSDWDADPLTAADIARLNLSHASNIFLSACSTSIPGLAHPDEGFHLATAMQLAGFSSVEGTLWPVDDAATVRLVAAFYRNLVAQGWPDKSVSFGSALHDAQVELMKVYRRYPSVWAAFTHFGIN